MDTESNDRLRALEEKIDDIYTIVRKMRGAQQRAAAFKIAYWAILIILGFMAVDAIQPYLTQMQDIYSSVQSTSANYTNLLKSLR